VKSVLTYLTLLIALFSFISNVYHLLNKDQSELSTYIADDAFYYFCIARNVLENGKLSFDGDSLTSGFHPLYLLYLLPILQNFASLQTELFLKIILSGSFFNWLIAGIIIFFLTKKITNSIGAAVATLFWFSNPFVFLNTTSCVEVSLSTLFLSLFIFINIYYLKAERASFYYGILSGLTGSFAILSRLDNIFFVIFTIFIVLIIRIFSRKQITKKGFLPYISTFIALSLFPLTGYLIWQKSYSAGFFPSSSQAIRQHTSIYIANHFTDYIKDISTIYLKSLYYYVGVPIIILGFFCLIHFIFKRKNITIFHSSENNRLIGYTITLIIPCAITGLFYIFYLHHLQPWYLQSTLLICSILTGIMFYNFYSILESKSKYYSLIFSIIFIVALTLSNITSPFSFSKTPLFPWQKEMYNLTKWIDDTLPEGSKTGSFNAGIYGFFSGKDIINLDGVVNDDALSALRSVKLDDYILKENIDYIMDYKKSIDEYLIHTRSWSYPGFFEVMRFKGNWMNSDIMVLKRMKGNPSVNASFLKGWDKLETWKKNFTFNWIIKNNADLKVDIFDTKSLTGLELAILPITALLEATEKQTMKVYFNGVPLGITILDNKWTRYEYSIPQEIFKSGANILSFEFSVLLSPSSHTGGKMSDKRELAAALSELGFY